MTAQEALLPAPPPPRLEPGFERCPWCAIFVRSAAGRCVCLDACGVVTCPKRNADGYTPPPVPRFARPP